MMIKKLHFSKTAIEMSTASPKVQYLLSQYTQWDTHLIKYLKLYFWTALSTMSVINFFSLLNSLISASYDFVNSNSCTEVKYTVD